MAKRAKKPREKVWLTTGQAAEILGISVTEVRRLVDRGLLDGERVASRTGLARDVRGRELPGYRRVGEASVQAMAQAAKDVDPGKGWITTGQAAAMLGISVPRVRRLVDSGRLEGQRRVPWLGLNEDALGRRLQGHRLISAASVKAWKAARRREGSA